MLANASKPTFSSSPDDSLAAPDVYGIRNGSGTINNTPGNSSPITSKFTQSLLGSKVSAITATDLGKITYPTAASVLSSLPALKLPALPNLGSLPAAATSRASGILGGSAVSSLRSVTGQASSLLGKALTVAGPIIAQAGGVTKLISDVKAGNALVIANVINGLTKAPAIPVNFKDPSSVVNSVVGLVSASSKAGIPNVLPNILSSVTTGNKDIASITNRLLPIVAKTADMPMLNTLATNNPKGAILAMAPNALSYVSNAFKKPEDGIAARVSAVTPTPLAVPTMQSITSTFAAVDPKWNFATKEGSSTPVGNVSVINKGSNDFKETITAGAIASTNPLDKEMLLGTMFPSTNNQTATINALQQSNTAAFLGTGN